MLSYLASDELEGRGLRTSGIDEAASYIAQQFEDAGLKQASVLGDYFQTFELTVDTKTGIETKLSIGQKSLKLDDDFVPMTFSAEKIFDAPVAFAGYGISNPDAKYDDFAGVDLKGKVVLALRYEPHDEKGKTRFDPHGASPFAALTEKAKAAAERGAVALLIVNPPNFHDERLTSASRRSAEKSAIPMLMITRKTANAILSQAGSEDLKSLQEKIDATGAPASRPLEGVSISGNVHIERVKKQVKNVVGLLPGKGRHKDEYIVIGAHYDHLGRGETGSIPGARNQIHNGADDNGSGTVAIIELANLLRGQSFDRSILFVAFTGEEQGLLGSDQFVKECPVPLEKIQCMINLDMVGRVKDDTLLVGGAGTAEGFDAIVAAVDERSPLKLKTAGGDVGARGGIGPSDHASFAKKKIPVMFLFSGTHKDYHRPTDDADKINYEGMAQVVDLTSDLLRQLDRLPHQQYVDRFDRGMTGGGRRSNVQLGVMPSYSAEETAGIVIEGTIPETPAAKAGLKEGDVLVQMGQDKLTGLTDLMDALAKHKPGDQVKIVFLRGSETMEADVTLAERKS